MVRLLNRINPKRETLDESLGVAPLLCLCGALECALTATAIVQLDSWLLMPTLGALEFERLAL